MNETKSGTGVITLIKMVNDNGHTKATYRVTQDNGVTTVEQNLAVSTYAGSDNWIASIEDTNFPSVQDPCAAVRKLADHMIRLGHVLSNSDISEINIGNVTQVVKVCGPHYGMF